MSPAAPWQAALAAGDSDGARLAENRIVCRRACQAKPRVRYSRVERGGELFEECLWTRKNPHPVRSVSELCFAGRYLYRCLERPQGVDETLEPGEVHVQNVVDAETGEVRDRAGDALGSALLRVRRGFLFRPSPSR